MKIKVLLLAAFITLDVAVFPFSCSNCFSKKDYDLSGCIVLINEIEEYGIYEERIIGSYIENTTLSEDILQPTNLIYGYDLQYLYIVAHEQDQSAITFPYTLTANDLSVRYHQYKGSVIIKAVYEKNQQSIIQQVSYVSNVEQDGQSIKKHSITSLTDLTEYVNNSVVNNQTLINQAQSYNQSFFENNALIAILINHNTEEKVSYSVGCYYLYQNKIYNGPYFYTLTICVDKVIQPPDNETQNASTHIFLEVNKNLLTHDQLGNLSVIISK